MWKGKLGTGCNQLFPCTRTSIDRTLIRLQPNPISSQITDYKICHCGCLQWQKKIVFHRGHSFTCEPHSTTSSCACDQFVQQWALCGIISYAPLAMLNPFLLSLSCISIPPVNAVISEDERVIHPLCSSYVYLPSTYMFSLNPVIVG